MDISFVILTFNSIEYIQKCIITYSESIKAQGLKAEFLIVDNGSTDGTAELIEREIFCNLPNSCTGRQFKLKKNLGTTISRNLALKEAVGDYIVVCDSDTEFIKGDWRNALNYLIKRREVGLIAPFISFENGEPQPTVRLFPTLTAKLHKLGKIIFKLPMDKKDFYLDFPWKEIKPIDTAASAFWLFKRELLYCIGYLDEKIFYAPEDVDFCLRVWSADKQVVFYPDLNIMHRAQRISHKKLLDYRTFSHFFGLLYYFRKHRYIFSREKIYHRLKIARNQKKGI